MTRIPFSAVRCACLALLAAAAPGCGATRSDVPADPQSGPRVEASRTDAALPAEPRRWTTEFQRAVVVSADRIAIEGPPGLLDHIATRTDPENHSTEVKTVPQGLRETYSALPGATLPVSAYLDRFEAHAWTTLVILENPFAEEVRVDASGDVVVLERETGVENRREQVTFRGALDVVESPAEGR